MIIELIMHRCGWTDIWYAHPGPGNFLRRRFGGRWHVGVWTGRDGDLLCVKHCRTNEEAEEMLSPGSHTIFGAVFKTYLKLLPARKK